MAKHLYHAPSECPVCGDTLITTRKGCLHCGTEIAGEFASCEFCNLNQADLDLLKVFLSSRGNLREVEKHLQVSYPTARARLDAVLGKLGLDGDPASPSSPSQAARSSEVDDEPTEYGEEVPSAGSAEDQILERVARGEISPEDAARLLG
ncbi:hypothetical protein BW730_11020 [Tessaracoccus aquimaris]|uniref:DUF2089 domain-containing protein n=1 Tax=Tessaracoccus aquimaris TaxID=1332264 RepID=A0A1Q2CPA6_9ACTN|nr:DUF2089 domain-containing protein [Tessaracoccus aquimaris]AQP47943.1 hypothetical protein BW730_11020 [Tessaracoccus aquimaris]